MGEPNYKQMAAIKNKQREDRLPCKIKGCCNTIPKSSKSGLCGEHWRNRKNLKSSGYYNK